MDKPDCSFFGESLESEAVLQSHPEIYGRCDKKECNITKWVCNHCSDNGNRKKEVKVIQKTVF